jgi:hypothetical protein
MLPYKMKISDVETIHSENNFRRMCLHQDLIPNGFGTNYEISKIWFLFKQYLFWENQTDGLVNLRTVFSLLLTVAVN